MNCVKDSLIVRVIDSSNKILDRVLTQPEREEDGNVTTTTTKYTQRPRRGEKKNKREQREK